MAAGPEGISPADDAPSPSSVSAVVCTFNSIASIEACLASLRAADVGELIVVDANSTDGTREIAAAYADTVLTDPGLGLGRARNLGIARTTLPYILNMGSDNVMPSGQLPVMLMALRRHAAQGVSARTVIEGGDFVSFGLNAWRQGRFIPGPAQVIGTPTLFIGDLLRAHPYDEERRFSDDSELCERWARQFGAHFAISEAFVLETGKTSWNDVVVRCRMYGVSDDEVFRAGVSSGWPLGRRIQSLLHPLTADFLVPARRLPMADTLRAAPFLGAFTALRYGAWGTTAIRRALRSAAPRTSGP